MRSIFQWTKKRDEDYWTNKRGEDTVSRDRRGCSRSVRLQPDHGRPNAAVGPGAAQTAGSVHTDRSAAPTGAIARGAAARRSIRLRPADVVRLSVHRVATIDCDSAGSRSPR